LGELRSRHIRNNNQLVGREPVTQQDLTACVRLAIIGIALLAPSLFGRGTLAAQSKDKIAGEFREQIVQVRSEDDIVDTGVLFAPPKKDAKAIAVIWIHGWGVNFFNQAALVV